MELRSAGSGFIEVLISGQYELPTTLVFTFWSPGGTRVLRAQGRGRADRVARGSPCTKTSAKSPTSASLGRCQML